MDETKVQQTNLCLRGRVLCDDLLTILFQIENFSDYRKWAKKLKLLKNQLNEIYWDL